MEIGQKLLTILCKNSNIKVFNSNKCVVFLVLFLIIKMKIFMI